MQQFLGIMGDQLGTHPSFLETPRHSIHGIMIMRRVSIIRSPLFREPLGVMRVIVEGLGKEPGASHCAGLLWVCALFRV